MQTPDDHQVSFLSLFKQVAKNHALFLFQRYMSHTLTNSFRYFGETEIPECEYACDWHKDAAKLKRAKQNGLQSEEWVSTQREMGRYESGCDGYD
jgi:hypothetical protein